MSGNPFPKVSYAVPPGGQALINRVTGETTASIPLWVYWLQIAHRHAQAAEVAGRNARALSLDHARKVSETGQPVVASEGNLEMVEAMVSITGASNAIDAVFGSLKQVDPWQPPRGRRSGTARSGEILEQLKQSFVVGKHAKEWARELDWLFEVRRDIVHHGEKPRPMIATAADKQHVVLSATEAFFLTADSARRATDLVERVLTACLANPRVHTRNWVERAQLLKRNFGRTPGPTGRPGEIRVKPEGPGVVITFDQDPAD